MNILLLVLMFIKTSIEEKVISDSIFKYIKQSSDIAQVVTSSNKIADDNLSQITSIIFAAIGIADSLEILPKSLSMNTSQLIKTLGYEPEEHTVKSNEYLLRMFRIKGTGPPILIMHGIFMTSDNWFGLRKKSLPIVLADLGYDVWIANARGNTYSRRHETLSPNDPEFWNFSFEEIGTEDLPACINYICTTAKVDKIAYIGYSQGTTVSYVLLSEKPEFNAKLSGIVSLSSVAYSSNACSLLFIVGGKLWLVIKTALEVARQYELVPHRPPISTITALFATTKLTCLIFVTVLYCVVGFNYGQFDDKHIKEQIRNTPGGCATKQVIHYFQNVDSGGFQKYNYGPEENEKRYGSAIPPSYKIESITSQIAFVHGDNDWLSNFMDVKRLISRLPYKPETFQVGDPFWNHLDFIWGKDANTLVYSTVADLMKKYTS